MRPRGLYEARRGRRRIPARERCLRRRRGRRRRCRRRRPERVGRARPRDREGPRGGHGGRNRGRRDHRARGRGLGGRVERRHGRLRRLEPDVETREADVVLGTDPDRDEVLLVDLRRTRDVRRERQEDVGAVVLRVRRREERSEEREVGEERHARLRSQLHRLDEAGEEARLAVLQPDVRRDGARRDDRLVLAVRPRDRSVEVRDLDGQLERDLLVVVDARLDVELDADVLVLERRHRDDADLADRLLRVDRRHRDRDAVPDHELGFLPLGDPELRPGEDLRVGVRLEEVDGDRRDREIEIGEGELEQLVPGERGDRACRRSPSPCRS